MGKGPEAILNNNKKTHIDGQKIHGMMFSITNHQRNANQNHNEITSQTCQKDNCQKRQQISVWKDVEKRELLCTPVRI